MLIYKSEHVSKKVFKVHYKRVFSTTQRPLKNICNVLVLLLATSKCQRLPHLHVLRNEEYTKKCNWVESPLTDRVTTVVVLIKGLLINSRVVSDRPIDQLEWTFDWNTVGSLGTRPPPTLYLNNSPLGDDSAQRVLLHSSNWHACCSSTSQMPSSVRKLG